MLETLAELSCWTLLLGILGGTRLLDTLVWHSSVTLLKDNYFRLTLLWDTRVGHFAGQSLWDTVPGHSSKQFA